ncbi:arginine-rich cyclin 1 [Prunus dulcis]|uniref:Arginine-rich cyclin 1 n=1 Tax=Prunus dulcis TaxID=3755 RepID=A0A4Y1RVY5_PRUDU|nr:arginine-rich cyclin 1 [Prunus dulcis]
MTVCVQHCVCDSRVRLCCGVVYAAAWRLQVPLPENPPWWKAFDAEKSGIDEVCRVLAHLYSLPKAKYVPVCTDGDSFTFSNKSCNSVSANSKGSSDSSCSNSPSATFGIEGKAIEDFSIKSKSERKMESSGNKSRDRER